MPIEKIQIEEKYYIADSTWDAKLLFNSWLIEMVIQNVSMLEQQTTDSDLNVCKTGTGHYTFRGITNNLFNIEFIGMPHNFITHSK